MPSRGPWAENDRAANDHRYRPRRGALKAAVSGIHTGFPQALLTGARARATLFMSVTTSLYFAAPEQVARSGGQRKDSQVEQGYRGPQACKIVGITYRQLDYWTRTALVTPSLQEATGSGSQRLYSFNDLLQLKVIKSLTDAGASLQKVRQAIDYVRDNLVEDNWSQLTIVADGSRVYALSSEEEVIDLLRSGQGVLGAVVAVDKVRDQLDGTLRELRPTPATAGYASTGARGNRVKGG